jgi:hypothetical protein
MIRDHLDIKVRDVLEFPVLFPVSREFGLVVCDERFEDEIDFVDLLLRFVALAADFRGSPRTRQANRP